MISMTKSVSLPIPSTRCFSVWFSLNQKSHYDTLGVARGASQADIKSAFYKLSKKHHPDANVNDPTATAKFQEIVEAYEILGNEDARKRYNIGMGPRNPSLASRPGFKTPDDPKAAFYKSRLANKMNKPVAGRMYDFDEWTKEHYSASVKSNRNMSAQTDSRTVIRDTNERRKRSNLSISVLETRFAIILGSVIVIALIILKSGNPDSTKSVK